MRFDNQLMAPVALALLTALVVSFLMTPVVKSFAYKVGAIDVPKDERRMHHKPIPRLGGQHPAVRGYPTEPPDAEHPAGRGHHRGAGRGG